MEVNLSPEMKQFVEQKVRTGSFTSANDVVTGALELLRIEDETNGLNADRLRAELEVGLEQSRRGHGTPLDMSQIKLKVRRRVQSSGS